MKEYKSFHVIQPYDYSLELVVTDNIIKSQRCKRRLKMYGDECAPSACLGMVWYDENATRLCILIHRKSLTYNTICHEIFHATHRMLEVTGTRFTPKNHEPYAYLCGYLSEIVMKQIKKWKLTIK